ncbi:MAG: hypothetical protein FGM27_03440 [Candidatus Omnitrophica bacterium]|nr:hypothetical protein [Candidatus Omnitrophota bacterium]
MNLTQELTQSTIVGSPRKFEVLLALRKAVLTERYEECPKLIERAFRLKATRQEVRSILENPFRHLEGF